MNYKSNFYLIIAFLLSLNLNARTLRQGFDITEYRECVRMASHFVDLHGLDSIYFAPKPEVFVRKYSSPVVGFENMWELWERPDSVVAISVRGSVTTMKSWLSNFHAAMVPATGKYHLEKDFTYSLCSNSLACVHGGWLGGMLAMSNDILAHIDSYYQNGYRDFIITGHSQGGGICFLLTAYLYQLRQSGRIPADVCFKTYCSAAPKPGNYAFACEYEYMTRGGWAYNVVNSDDWVPEVPLSVQQISDFNPTNPFSKIDEVTDTMGVVNRFKIKFLFNTLSKPLVKSEKTLRKYLGKTVGGMLIDEQPEYSMPDFVHCASYMRVGQIVILKPDEKYHKSHPQNAADPFEHHMFRAYSELADDYVE